MQRVLSFQTARGFGESSEFITKRMCFSFLFSVGFLCILCGFLVGRFAAGRAVDIRAEKTRLQLAGNGLENTEHLREILIRWLEENTFSNSYVSNNGDEQDVKRVKDTLLALQFFQSVVGNRSCIVATVLGTHEIDRYIVLLGSGEGVSVIVELSRAFKVLDEESDWRPKRTLKFMISLEKPSSTDSCHAFLLPHVRAKVVAFIALDVTSIQESGYFVTTGSDIVQSTVLQAGVGVENPNYKNNLGKSPTIIEACSETSCPTGIPRLRLDIPNAALTFVSKGNGSLHGESSGYFNAYRRALARIASTSVWRLSEMTLFPWDNRIVNPALINILESLYRSKYGNIVDRIGETAKKITNKITAIDGTFNHLQTANPLEVRIANDLSMQIRQILLCCDDELRSRSDWITFHNITMQSNRIEENLGELLICYENANDILQEDVT